MQRVSYLPWVMVLALTLMLLPGLGATLAQDRKFANISGEIQLISPLSQKQPNDMEKMALWPSKADIEANYARTDRAAKLPPVYPEGRSAKDSKPVIPGGMSPQAALDEAQVWIRQVLKAELIPPDLAKRLIPVRAEAGPKSTIICRYQVDGHAIQITQTRWGIVVVIKPKTEGSLDKAGEFGSRVVTQFFNRGKELADLSQKRVQTPSERLALFTLDQEKLKKPEVLENWWGSATWYTDGRAVGVFLHKRLAGEQHTPTPKDPWF